MPRKEDRHIIAGIDIGTSKVTVMVGSVEFDGLDIIGVGSAPSQGLKKGLVVNIEETTHSIKTAIEQAEAMAGCRLSSVFVGITGNHIRSVNSTGVVAIQSGIVNASDVERVIDAARAVAIPADQKVLHILPQEFIIDNERGIRDPIGMSGVRLEVRVHLVIGSLMVAQNLVQCVRRCGLEVNDLVLSSLASSSAVLTEDEKQLGVCLVDIGGGTTDVAIFAEGAIQKTVSIPVAGEQVTNDIAVAFRVATQEAERVKRLQACALIELADPEQVVALGKKKVSQVSLAEVIEPRFDELFSFIEAEISRQGCRLGAGIVLTGGSAHLEGVVELAEEVFQMPVRVGVAHDVSGVVEVVHNPQYSTAVGLLQFGYQNRGQHHRFEFNPVRNFKGLVGRMKGWLQGYF